MTAEHDFFSELSPGNAGRPPSLLQDRKPKEKRTVPSFLAAKEKRDPFDGTPLVRGPAPARGTFAARLKNLKSRDIAFIAAGLSVLLMAPIAEHLLSSPDEENGFLRAGFDQKGQVFAAASNPYEDGVAGVAPGGLLGQATEVVTPLNVRDPASLIINPMAEPKPPKEEAKPPAKPAPARDWKDAISNAARKGVTKAVEKVRLPQPTAKLAKMTLSAVPSGSTHASLTALSPPTSKGLFGSPEARSNIAGVTAAPGYRGAARRSLASGSGSPWLNFDGRRGPVSGDASLGGLPGQLFTGAGAGSGSETGSTATPGSSSKDPGGSNLHENKNIGINQKEDLAFLRRKMEMEKAVGLKWDKKKYDQLERKKMLEQIAAQTAQQAFLKILDKLLEGLGGGKGGGKDDGGGKGGDKGGDKGGGGGSPPPGGDDGKKGPDSGQGPEKTPRPDGQGPQRAPAPEDAGGGDKPPAPAPLGSVQPLSASRAMDLTEGAGGSFGRAIGEMHNVSVRGLEQLGSFSSMDPATQQWQSVASNYFQAAQRYAAVSDQYLEALRGGGTPDQEAMDTAYRELVQARRQYDLATSGSLTYTDRDGKRVTIEGGFQKYLKTLPGAPDPLTKIKGMSDLVKETEEDAKDAKKQSEQARKTVEDAKKSDPKTPEGQQKREEATKQVGTGADLGQTPGAPGPSIPGIKPEEPK